MHDILASVKHTFIHHYIASLSELIIILRVALCSRFAFISLWLFFPALGKGTSLELNYCHWRS